MRQTLAALFLFGVSFGYVEAAVVAYLRAIYDPIRQQLHPERPKGDLFPLITPEQLRAAGGPENTRRLAIEIGREAATMLMLAAVGLAVARDSQQWLAAFLIGFGVWDISFYAFLRLIIDWPGSWLTWDLLFLLPVPWVGPVIAPILVSLTMIFCGVAALRRKIRIRALHWLAIISGGFIIILA